MNTQPVAIVTGAARGIGAALSAALAADGYRVALADLDTAGIDTLAAELPGALAVGTDVRSAAEVDRLVAVVRATFGRVDVLINNAMICHEGALVDLTPEEIETDVAVNLIGPMLLTRAIVPAMSGGGSILNISSVNALMALGDDAYSAAKAGLLQLTRSTAARYVNRPDFRSYRIACPAGAGWADSRSA